MKIFILLRTAFFFDKYLDYKNCADSISVSRNYRLFSEHKNKKKNLKTKKEKSEKADNNKGNDNAKLINNENSKTKDKESDKKKIDARTNHFALIDNFLENRVNAAITSLHKFKTCSDPTLKSDLKVEVLRNYMIIFGGPIAFMVVTIIDGVIECVSGKFLGISLVSGILCILKVLYVFIKFKKCSKQLEEQRKVIMENPKMWEEEEKRQKEEEEKRRKLKELICQKKRERQIWKEEMKKRKKKEKEKQKWLKEMKKKIKKKDWKKFLVPSYLLYTILSKKIFYM
ncbi:hypothetical protein MKS88_003443 [Plasmodium brasilianum]|uniref:Uncharacterized protein n=1 Tax=Plasmodium brasilianum TaxID=5824 RepID=A0ACB9Y9E2_PLABR|nr:hypothetical protein MKS88_003443 [Plasmodium brasilianum]